MSAADGADGYVPTLDSVLEASSLIEAFDRHDAGFGDQLFAATPGTTWALVAFASQAIKGFATLAEDTPDGVLQQLRLVTTEVVAAMTAEGEAS
jgi:hypothetical protein